jgi:hypothetical protein
MTFRKHSSSSQKLCGLNGLSATDRDCGIAELRFSSAIGEFLNYPKVMGIAENLPPTGAVRFPQSARPVAPAAVALPGASRALCREI